MSTAGDLESNVMANLRVHYRINEAIAEAIYRETMLVYHRLFTITNLNELNSVDDRVLFALIIVIAHYYDRTDSTRFLFSIVMFIVITSRKADAEYMFIQWLSFSAQDKNIDNGLDVFIYSLKAMREHFEKENVQLFEPFHDLFKALNRNILLLEKEVLEKGTNEQENIINKVKNDFHSYLYEHEITLSSDSDNDDDDDLIE